MIDDSPLRSKTKSNALMAPALLATRSIIRIAGGDARKWLHNLVTSSIESLENQQSAFAALLTPQGKIIADFFIVPDGRDLLLDCDSAIAPALIKRLSIYKLRADVAIADASSMLAVRAFWGDAPPALSQGIVFADPRDERLGWRMIAPPDEIDACGADADAFAAYDAHRIALGVPDGGRDFAYGETFPHDANMDRLHGVDFKKGCYIGQEVVSRVEHRGTARKRIVRVQYDGAAPAPFTPVSADDIAIGESGSSQAANGLAMLRLDKVEDAVAAGRRIHAGGVTLRVV